MARWPRVSRAKLALAKARKAYRKRLLIGRRGRTQHTIYRYKRSTFIEGAYNSDPLSNQFVAFTGTLGGVTNYTEFTALYDQYKIERIRITLMPRQTVTTGVMVGQVASAPVFSVIDYDDNAAPSSISQLLQYQNCKTTRGLVVHSRSWRPAVETSNLDVGGAGAFSGIKFSPWLDCADTNVQHNAAKIAFQAPTGGVSIKYDLKIDYYLAFKNVR